MEVARSAGLSRLSCDFLGLVAANGRTDHLPVIAVHYRKLQDDELHRARARVRSAVALSAAARGALVAKLERRFEGRHVVLEEVVDPTMLGGFIVEIGGVVLDASLEGQLDTIRRRLGRGDTDPEGKRDAGDAMMSLVSGGAGTQFPQRQGRHGCDQRLDSDGLGDMKLESRSQNACAMLGTRVGSERGRGSGSAELG
jgi:hypothetical protein